MILYIAGNFNIPNMYMKGLFLLSKVENEEQLI